MRAALGVARRRREESIEKLFDFLRIPSVSAKPRHASDVRRAAEWVRDALMSAGLSAEIHETDGHPIVVGEWRGAGRDAKTVLIYGHYDVQPPEPLELWESGPFDPAIRDGRIYARGAADDKGQLFMHIAALAACLEANGRLPVNVVFVAEGEEEVGSPNLAPFVRGRADAFAADAVVISDSAMYAPNIPSLLVSLRGLAYFEIHARGPKGDLHSGAYGGAVQNPANALSRIIAGLHDRLGRIAIDGFYDDVRDPSAELKAQIASLPFDSGAFATEAGAIPLGGEADRFSVLERLWTRPSCDVNGMISGYIGDGAKTVLPSSATAKVSFRLVPEQDPLRVGRLLEAHVARECPLGVEVEVRALHGGRPWTGTVDGPAARAARTALEAAFGTPPALIGEGGTIPIVPELEEILDAPTLLMGFSLPGSNLHAPNEWLSLDCFTRGVDALIRFYSELGHTSAGS